MQTAVSLNFIYALGKWKMLAETYNKANLRWSKNGESSLPYCTTIALAENYITIFLIL